MNHDYAVFSDRFAGSYPYPSNGRLIAAGSYAQHFAHMSAYWNGQLSQLAQIRQLPDRQLIDAYKAGFINTQITRAGTDLKTGVNGYDKEYSHDVIGILANLLTQGFSTDGTVTAVNLLLRLRDVVGTQTQYDDGIWTYSWPWAIYLQKTGDIASVKANFATPGPLGDAAEPSIEDTAHAIAAAPHRAGRHHRDDERHRRERLLDDRRLRRADGPGGLPMAGAAARRHGGGQLGRRRVRQPARRGQPDPGRDDLDLTTLTTCPAR